MDVEQRGLNTSVTRIGSDLVDIHLGACEVGQSQVPRRVRRELREVRTLGDTSNDL